MSLLTEHAQVLITVKASPEPSAQYVDTVCVAGIRIDRDPSEWIRLFPVPFRYLDSDKQFRKYEVVELEIARQTRDPRLESFRPETPSITRVRTVKDKGERANYLRPLVGPSMCDLRAGIEANINGPSLGLVVAREVTGFTLSPHPGWSDDDKRKLAQSLEQPDLFNSKVAPMLEAPRYIAKYQYFCESKACKGHNQSILDWEMTMLQRHYRSADDAVAREKIRLKYFNEFCGPRRQPHFFVGNFAAGPKRKNFSVLGVYSPAVAESTMLF